MVFHSKRIMSNKYFKSTMEMQNRTVFSRSCQVHSVGRDTWTKVKLLRLLIQANMKDTISSLFAKPDTSSLSMLKS